jgi:hypothetical protein
VTVVRKTFLPETIGDDHPRPGIAAVHSMLVSVDHFSGRCELAAEGLDVGPRKLGHSGSAAKMAQTAGNSPTMTFLMVSLFDYSCQGPLDGIMDPWNRK